MHTIEMISRMLKLTLFQKCGKKSFFGGQLPCPDNGPAREPDDALRKKLIEVCGESWNEGPICCESEQVCLYHKQKTTSSNTS